MVEGDVRDKADVEKALEGVDFSEIMKSGKTKKVCFLEWEGFREDF